MKYTPEQHLQIARAKERDAKTEADPERSALLKRSAYLHRMTARAGRAVQAKKLTEEAISRAQQATHEVPSIVPLTNFSSSFDEETYKKALPFFKAGTAHFEDAASDVAGMVKCLVRHLAQNGMSSDAIERMRPYVRRFIEDEQARVVTENSHESGPLRVVRVQETEMSRFLLRVEKKFRALLEESPDPQWEIQNALRRMEAEDMLWQRLPPNASPKQAAFLIFSENEALTEWWTDIRDRGWWESALTPEELITAILPKYDTLD